LLRGSIASEAFAVNNGAEVVGAMTLAEGNRAAFLWKREYIIDLNTVIDPVLGWNLQEARAINNSGQIAGWGYLEHRHHGYLLTPSDRAPTPASPVPPPHQGAEAIDIPDIAPERTEMSFQDMIMQQIAEEARR